MRPYSGNLYLINKKAGNTVKILAVIVTIAKLFHNVKETRNRPHNLTILLLDFEKKMIAQLRKRFSKIPMNGANWLPVPPIINF